MISTCDLSFMNILKDLRNRVCSAPLDMKISPRSKAAPNSSASTSAAGPQLSSNPSRNAAASACINAVVFTSTCSLHGDLYTPSSPEDQNWNDCRPNSSVPRETSRLSIVQSLSSALRRNRSRKDNIHVDSVDMQPLEMSPGLISGCCSVCRIHASTKGRLPTKFTFTEIRTATKNFAQNMFLAEGERDFVFKGILKDGSTVAVKIGMEESDKFFTEIELLSCAHHPNVVALVGYCNEEGRSMLIYDYVCNGTLDWHLSACNPSVLPWQARRTIAVQVARGLLYLHEHFPKGVIVHHDIRPKNILLTHDFSPVIAGFGFAKCIQRGEKALNTPLVGKSGYSAPEYLETGEVTEKVDVYSFGILLVELISGRKVMADYNIHDKQNADCLLVEQARPILLEDFASVVQDILDPRLKLEYKHYELYCMVGAASMCIRKDPSARPKMHQVLCALEDARERSLLSHSTSCPNSPNVRQ